MESSMRKRGHNQEYTDNLSEGAEPKRQKKLPALASVIVEAVKVDSLQRLCSSLEPLFRRIVSEEVERALSKLESSKTTPSSQEPKKIQGLNGRNLQIRFRTRMPPHLFTGGKVEGEQGSAVHVVLTDANTGNVVQAGEDSTAKLNVVVLDGDFNDEDWTRERFESFVVKERQGKSPILTGHIHVVLKEGVGTLGELSFTDNSSWIRSRKFRLGVKSASGFHIREAKTEPFAVKDHRGELYKKHYPPVLHDEVWRLDRIAKGGVLHKKLVKSNVITVEDFLRILVKEPQKLRSLLGSGMSNRMWDNTVEHAKTCVLGGKLYVYYTEQTHNNTGVVFNHIYEFQGLIANDHFLSLESLNHDQKISADIMVKAAYENWHKAVEYDGKLLKCLPEAKRAQPHQETVQCHQNVNSYSAIPQQQIQYPCNQLGDYTLMEGSSVSGSDNGVDREDVFTEEIRVRSSEMLESDDMQKLLKTFGIAGGFTHIDESCYGFNDRYEAQVDKGYGRERGRGSGKAVVGWLKLKAALRWGIFIRKKAAQRRPQIVEID
uniref:Calmodulin-binding protein n=1 Tax=Brassica campestris TaxID=3711 RepID=M4D437_BRACM